MSCRNRAVDLGRCALGPFALKLPQQFVYVLVIDVDRLDPSSHERIAMFRPKHVPFVKQHDTGRVADVIGQRAMKWNLVHRTLLRARGGGALGIGHTLGHVNAGHSVVSQRLNMVVAEDLPRPEQQRAREVVEVVREWLPHGQLVRRKQNDIVALTVECD